MPQVKIIAKNFMDMVASLPAIKLDKLYNNVFICEAILRSLPPLAKKYVLQMLYINVPVPATMLEEWVLADGASKHRVAIDRLIQLRIFSEIIDRKRGTSYSLNPTFQNNLQKHIISGGVLPREPMNSDNAIKLPSLQELETYALKQWECFLLQLINSGQGEKLTGISSSMMRIFQRGLLSQRDKDGPRLTENGFQFLLMDTNAQLWYIIREYISNAEERDVEPADLISFLLELSFHVTGEAYNLNTLTEVQINTLKDLADLGLVKLQQGRKDSWFIPTKLATNLSVSLADSSARKEGFVVMETNFRMYAYSTSKLQCEILRLFARIEYQLPNLIACAITKESLYNAFDNGITSDQIITFLQQNSHPRCADRVPSIPENVTDQIRLWESDLKRIEMTQAHFYDEFPSKDVFEAACDFAREWGGLLWEDSKRMRLVVKSEVHNQMQQEELQFMPLPKRSRKDENDVNYSLMDSRANDITTIANGSMLETLIAFESQASRLMLSTNNNREIVAYDHNPRSGPRTRIFGCEIFANASVDVNPIHCLEESKHDSPSPREAGCCEQLEIGNFEIADNQILFVDGEDKNRKDLFPKEEIQTHCVQSDPATSLIPSESDLRSVQIVEDTEDLLVLSCNPLKEEDHAVYIFSTPVRELPLKPSATTADQDESLVQKTQDQCKSPGNSKAYSCSPEKKHTGKTRATQKSKQNFNCVQPRDQNVDMNLSSRSKHSTFPDFDLYTIVEEEGSGGYGVVYKANRKTDGTDFAIKCPHAGAQKHYVNNEIRMLKRFGGENFIIKYEGCLKNGDSDCIILEHLEHDRPDLLKREVDVYQLQFYGYCMFKALSSLHKQGVVHRDVKLGNFLFSRKVNKGYLIDFNLAMDLHQKYRRADKSKAVSNLPTTSKKHHTLVKSPDETNRVTNKSSQKTLAPNSLKKAAGKIRARNDMSRWERFNSQGAEGSALTSAKDMTSTMNHPLGEKRREPLPCHGRKELLNFLQETMSGPIPNHEVSSRAPTSMRKRVAALPGKTEKELLYLTPMPLRSNGRPEAGDVNQKDGPCSGTKGLRAPEVCFRSSHQGPKIDVWSAGVTLLYLMMGRTPFTGDPEQNIKDIAQLRGSEELWEVAKLHNRESSFPEELYESRYLKGMELRKWCELNTKRREFLDVIPRSLLDLVDKCLTVNPRRRISADDALKHDFFHPIHETIRKQRILKQMQSQPSVVADAVGQTLN